MKNLRRYLASDGFTGSYPEWWPTLQAAKYLKVPWWDLLEHSVWFMDKALVAMTAESQAEKNRQNRK